MGSLLKFLDDEDLARNTILIFQTDNGSLLGPRISMLVCVAGRRNFGGGHRVPCFIRWPDGNLAKPQTLADLLKYKIFCRLYWN